MRDDEKTTNDVQAGAESAAETEGAAKPSGGWLVRLVGLPGLLALAVLALDQLTKFAVMKVWPVPGSAEFVVIPSFFKLVHVRTPGAAWGILGGHTWLLAVVSAMACLLVILLWKKLTGGRAAVAIPCGVLLGGIAGNLIDRVFFEKGVVDFLYFHYREIWGWPAFNVADAAISCSIVFLIVLSVFDSLREKKRKAGQAND